MTKIQLKRDTAANWSINNPTPSAGEPCFEIDTGKLKIGDGITAYNSLPYQGGTSDTAGGSGDVTSAGNNTFTGMNIFKGKSLNVGDDNNYSNIASFTGAEYVVGDQEDLIIINPVELGASYDNTVLKSNVRVLETDTASSTEKAYSIMTKSPTNNKYMAGMAMPSNKYIDLTLGASGTTYTAPANGYLSYVIATQNPNMYFELHGLLGTGSYGGGNVTYGYRGFMPLKKGEVVTIYYLNCSTSLFRFVYAEGSKPAT
jgi:hypothetical protein